MRAQLSEALTPREADVLEALRAGLSNKRIARSMQLSEQTVKFHLKNIFLKMGANDRTHAIILANAREDVQTEHAAKSPTDIRREMEPVTTPLAFLRRTRKLFGERLAVVDGEARFTYRQFIERCERAAHGFLAIGLQPGDRVATIASNTHAHLETFYAVPLSGGVIVPINPRLTPAEIANIIRHSGARVVCASRECVESLAGIRADLGAVAQFIAFDGAGAGWLHYEELLMRAEPTGEFPQVQDDQLLAINYTSGTVHEPRGVMVSHRSAWFNVVGCQQHWTLEPHDRYLWLLPFFHGNGWGFVWTVTAAGAAHVCVRTPTLESLTDWIVKEDATAMCAGRSALRAIAELPDAIVARLPTKLWLLTAGAPPSLQIIKRIEARLHWRVSHGYGLTETAVFVAMRLPPPDGRRLDSAAERARWNIIQGVDLLTSGEVRVVDEDGVDVLQDGQTLGEVVTRGPTLMQGYYRDPVATRRAFAGGWFHTGDAAVMHPDGALEIRDRLKDIIISNDQLIASIDVEDAIARHPSVVDVAVVGRPDPTLGEAIHAFIVCRPGALLNLNEISEFCATNLAIFKQPHHLHVVEDLPKTGSGKVIKHKLRSIC